MSQQCHVVMWLHLPVTDIATHPLQLLISCCTRAVVALSTTQSPACHSYKEPCDCCTKGYKQSKYNCGITDYEGSILTKKRRDSYLYHLLQGSGTIQKKRQKELKG